MVCVHSHAHVLALLRRPENSFVELLLSFHDHMGLRLELRSPVFHSKYLNSHSPLVCPAPSAGTILLQPKSCGN